MKKILVGLLIVALTLAVTGSVGSYMARGGDTYIEKTTAQQRQQDAFTQSFVYHCVDGNESYRSYCECTADDLIDTYGFKDVYDMAEEYMATGIVPDEMHRSSNTCADKWL